ncbi:hypothetical protein Y032_0258g455 [Ancylostoma ceylanicum]|uniref:Uncharacterized protein n=1 Tax=Ancylostoma ceylanicum TaxID=53326 RepID=A0A016SBG8_9BILA|nr:hypothetical protein Y032_0258g455 [Ancylostoma ceylanicum]
MSEELAWQYKRQEILLARQFTLIQMARFAWRYTLRVNMFISFLAGHSIIIGVDSDGSVDKAADSQYQNHGTIPGVIEISAR